MDLGEHYRSYISQINAGCGSGALSRFVHEGVVHNDSVPLAVDEYAQIIIDSQASFPGLLFEIDMLVAENAKDKDTHAADGDGTVATRLKLTFSAPAEGGKTHDSKKQVFYEHVFYRFDGGKISRVWSLLDGVGLKWAEERAAAAASAGKGGS